MLVFRQYEPLKTSTQKFNLKKTQSHGWGWYWTKFWTNVYHHTKYMYKLNAPESSKNMRFLIQNMEFLSPMTLIYRSCVGMDQYLTPYQIYTKCILEIRKYELLKKFECKSFNILWIQTLPTLGLVQQLFLYLHTGELERKLKVFPLTSN